MVLFNDVVDQMIEWLCESYTGDAMKCTYIKHGNRRVIYTVVSCT